MSRWEVAPIAPFALLAPSEQLAPLQALEGIEWGAVVAPFVPLDLGALELAPVHIGNGIVPRFDDPFSTYRVAGAEVTVYESNYDGAMIRGGALHSALRAHIAARYGVHRFSDPQWK